MSRLQDQGSFYDFDRDILCRTPPLEAVKPNFKSRESPPPLVHLSPSSDSTDGEDANGARSSRKHRKRKGRTKPSFADGLLIRSLDPNEVQSATIAERDPLESASQSEAEEEDNEAVAEVGRRQMRRSDEVVQSQATQVAAKSEEELAKVALAISHDPDNKDDRPMVDTSTPATMAEENSPPSPPTASGAIRRSSHQEQSEASVPSKREDPPKKQLNTRPRPLEQGLGLNLKPSYGYEEDDEDSLSKSPVLAKFAITRDDAPADFILPALQLKSPPRSSPAGSPEQKQNLPNIQTAIGDLQDTGFVGCTSMSPMNRHAPGHPGQYASPASYSALSPRGSMGPPSYYDWRTTTGNSNASTSSSHTSSTAAGSTPASSITGPSPAASHPSPMAAVPEQDRESTRLDSSEENEENDQSESHSEPPPTDGSGSTRSASGNYKCTYHECNAAPFQTQYLLRSHMNVHSNSRTYFCPVKGCPRGPGGQGFKRKNEMIRHGLVHTSPAYICPFCPDQQHKYPRPDNLQRHVRQHHIDKDRDDPILRDVLNQRTNGERRGGRRRMRS